MVSARRNVLVVDDFAPVRRVHRRLLEPLDVRPLEAGTGERALELADAEKLSLALVDAVLPGSVDGFEVCRRLRARSVPVFLVTGEARDESDRLRAYAAGATAYFAKPVETESLLRAVKTALAEPKPLLQFGLAAAKARGAKRVLVVDDSEDQLGAISAHLESGGMIPFAARDGMEGLVLAHTIRPDAIVLDMGLPDIPGQRLLSYLRADPDLARTPILVWTGSDKEGLEVACLQHGADEFLVKGSHDMAALPIYLDRQLRSRAAKSEQAETLIRGSVSVEVGSRTVSVGGKVLHGIGGKEYELLLLLMRRSPEVVSWREIERSIWKTPDDMTTDTAAPATVRVLVNDLKRRLDGARVCVVTVRGFGLRFDPLAAD